MWYQLQIEHCHRDIVDELSEVLETTGALSITLTDKNDDPVLEPEPGTTPLWPDVIINALYSDEATAIVIQHQLASLYSELHCTVNTLADQDWERAWMDDFKPQQFGKNLWVCPSWITPPEPDAVNLILDPGLAFGTGNHATTSLCLHWLGNTDLHGKSVIDYGCGSGILALAALKLGAKFVSAVDIDPQALQATESNATVNHIDDKELAMGFPDSLTTTVDLLVANILLAPLLKLQERFRALLNPDGVLVVSGILTEQAPLLIESYQENFIHQQTHDSEGWSLLVFTCR
ncbi:MAG: 50S ribosomal protein L11 methyltransferase [Legionella sp.]|nr:50S ribosomal protein L11 methyltransferase [Legionella sp.]